MSTKPSEAYQREPVAYLKRIAELFAGYKSRSLEFLRLEPGLSLLDAGCGAGDDLLALARRFGNTVKLCGVDHDARPLAEAGKRAENEGAAITFHQAAIDALPFPDRSFDRVRTDRVFQHLQDPGAALRELIRVTKPGGWICTADVDWGSLLLDHPDPVQTDRLCAFIRDTHTLGRSGRGLYARMVSAGLREVEAYAEAVAVTDWDIACLIWGLREGVAAWAAAGKIPPEKVDLWWRQARDYADKGLFLGSQTGIIARGKVADS